MWQRNVVAAKIPLTLVYIIETCLHAIKLQTILWKGASFRCWIWMWCSCGNMKLPSHCGNWLLNINSKLIIHQMAEPTHCYIAVRPSLEWKKEYGLSCCYILFLTYRERENVHLFWNFSHDSQSQNSVCPSPTGHQYCNETGKMSALNYINNISTVNFIRIINGQCT